MRLIHASKHAACRGTCLNSSCIESRPRHHGFISTNIKSCSRSAIRGFSVSRDFRNAIAPDEKLQKTLGEYKASFRPTIWKPLDAAWIKAQNATGGTPKEVKLTGYLGSRRDINRNLAFTMLRDKSQSMCIQLVSSSNTEGETSEAHERIRSLREWTPVLVRGKLIGRQPVRDRTVLGAQLITHSEIAVTHVEPLNDMPEDLIMKEKTVFGPTQRHLQLRVDGGLRDNILYRARITQKARWHLNNRQWTEIETPILFKSTPEGAREFLVPTRQKGFAYALPQSPQQYKQILMASGFAKYYQLARCFRDEDLRADRQPEFTQLDMEMSFAGEEDVMAEIETLLGVLWEEVAEQPLPEKYPRMTYHDAMEFYGSDKPDLRYEAKIYNVTKHVPEDLISKITPLEDPIIEAFRIPISCDPKITREFIGNFLDSPDGKPYLENAHGQPGVFVCDYRAPMKGLGPLGYKYLMEAPEIESIEQGDLLVLQARPNAPLSGGSTTLGNLRPALYKAAISQDILDAPGKNGYKFVWITDFPLFTPNNDADPGQGGSAGFSSTHHPFTAPKTPADVDLLLTDPARATAAHYDLVLNGVELGGGSRRIHNAAVQELIFRNVLKMKPERIEDFRHLLDVLGSACPPHAGIALGWDRLIAVMRGKESIRDFIAFPKTGRGEDALVGSPNDITQGQLDTYHLEWKP